MFARRSALGDQTGPALWWTVGTNLIDQAGLGAKVIHPGTVIGCLGKRCLAEKGAL